MSLNVAPPKSTKAPALRVPPLAPPFRVVLIEPEIPPNTGNVARICAATCSPLHLVCPLAQSRECRSHRALRRLAQSRGDLSYRRFMSGGAVLDPADESKGIVERTGASFLRTSELVGGFGVLLGRILYRVFPPRFDF